MTKRSDDELTLFFYGEHPSPASIERALATDPELGRRYDALRRELTALDVLDAPEPRPGLEARMWARIVPALEARSAHRRPLGGWLGWATLAAAVLAVAVGSFVANRVLRPAPAAAEREAVAPLEALSPQARARVLAATLADHLASSERLLIELSNGAPFLDEERRWAEILLRANRLYRRAAERAGERRVAALLAELEPPLAQLANAPADEAEPSGLGSARTWIESRDLLFKVRVTRHLKEPSS